MKLKNFLIILLPVIFLSNLSGAEVNKRPCELQFYVNSHLTTTTLIEYNQKGDVLKMSSYEDSKLIDYARYKYDSNGRLTAEKSYNYSNILLKTRLYSYDNSGLITGEKVYSPSGNLIEYLVISYINRKIDKIDYYKSDDNLFQTIEFKYTGNLLNAMSFNKIGKFVMIMKPVYDKNMLLIGHTIKHSSADVKIETKYIYEEGFATEDSLTIIFR